MTRLNISKHNFNLYFLKSDNDKNVIEKLEEMENIVDEFENPKTIIEDSDFLQSKTVEG